MRLFQTFFILLVFSAISLLLCAWPIWAQATTKKQTKVKIGFAEGYQHSAGLLESHFSRLKNCLENEMDIEVIPLTRQALLPGELSSLQVLIFPRNQIPLSNADFSALDGWIRRGGCLVFLCEPLEGNDWSLENVWQFLADYGIRARISAVTGSAATIVTFTADFGIVPHQVSMVECAVANCFLPPTDNAKVLCQNADGQTLGLFNPSVGKGKVIVLGDSDCWSDGLFDRADNKEFFVNTIRYCLPGVDLQPLCLKVKTSKSNNKRQITLMARIKNLAKAPSVATFVRFKLVPVGLEIGEGEVLAESALPALPGKKVRKLRLEAVIPRQLIQGQYLVIVTVDPQRFCNDLVESNNELAAACPIEIN